MSTELPVRIDCGGRGLIGVLHRPECPAASPGVVIVVGGPQYRVGSHRQFVLLARDLCGRGTPVLRFDLAGMGDSDGEVSGFEHVDSEIRAAVDELQSHYPHLRGVCLLGLCDGASAALIYARGDRRVTHMVLLNPWVRTGEIAAQAYLDNYYGGRLRSAGFWGRMLANPAAAVRAAAGFVANLRRAALRRTGDGIPVSPHGHFLSRMLAGKKAFGGRTLVLLSGNDRVAGEFESLLSRSGDWRAAFADPDVITRKLPGASHTFSRRAWRDWAARATAEFISA